MKNPSDRRRLVELERLRLELQRSETYLSEAQRLSHTGSVGWNPTTGEIFWSDETYRIFEYGPEVKPTLDLVFQRMHPDDRARVRQIRERAAKDGTDFDYEYRLLMPDNRVKWLHILAHAAKDSSGNLKFFGALIDITERRNAEEKIREQEIELRQILNLMPQMVVVMTPDGRISYANEVMLQYFGVTLDDFRALDFRAHVLHPDDVKLLGEERRKALALGLPFECEQRMRGKDGKYRWFLLRYNPLMDTEGRVVRWYGSGIDIEDRKRAEEMRLEERVRERTRIARELHDTLLQSFQGLLLLFQTGINLLPARPAEARKAFESAIDQAAQAITEGRDAIQGLRSLEVEINDLAVAIRTLGEGLAAEHRNHSSPLFHVEVVGTPLALHPILRGEVYRLVREALRNTFQHAHAKHIKVEIHYEEREFRVHVRDDGKGIDPKLLTPEGRSGHFGLHGMRERAKLVGGKLTLWSEIDAGTEVQLSIPAGRAYAASPRHSWLSEKLSRKGTAMKS